MKADACGMWRRLLAGVAVLLLGVGVPPAAADAAAGPASDSADDVTVEHAVTQELTALGSADFWVVFDDRADLSGADGIADWAERGRYVYDQLTATARSSQAEVAAELAAQGVAFESFWVVNAVLVRGGDRTVLDAVRAESGVAEIRATRSYQLPDPIDESAPEGARIGAVEWGITSIGADRVWADFDARGQGIVVGSIDTGVEHTHPALAAQYRGSQSDGSLDHNYSWWDPSLVCGSPSLEPCDNNGHGTHTMGTMVGDDGAGNQIGVAPQAQWIAAKGCETNECSDSALMSSGQFMLAPTDLDGENARPELRPHVVNNSWGDIGGNTFFDEVVASWVAAGIFPVFSNGNAGPGCGTAGSPADGPDAYAVGAYDISNTIAWFSSRGPGRDNEVRPHIAAPGVDVRSSFPGNQYAVGSGTSMAAPHVSGTVALIWSATRALERDVEVTRELLDRAAIDVDDTTCGGTPENNNVYGEGRLDAYAAVEQSDPAEPPADATQDIVATVPDEPGEGSLVITVDPDDRTVTLPELASAGDRLATSGELRPVTVTDTRTTTTPGWDASAQVSDFTTDNGLFGGGFLGWTPSVASQSDGQDVTPGAPVAPGFPTGDGLSVPQTLANAEAGAGVGTAVLGAGLALEIPVDTVPGTYTAVLTLTAI